MKNFLKKLWEDLQVWYGTRSSCCRALTEYEESYDRTTCGGCKRKIS